MHKTKIEVWEDAKEGKNFTNVRGEKVKREEYNSKLIDGAVASNIRITCDSVNGLPNAVFLDGGYPLYETWVLLGDKIIGYDKGRVNYG